MMTSSEGPRDAPRVQTDRAGLFWRVRRRANTVREPPDASFMLKCRKFRDRRQERAIGFDPGNIFQRMLVPRAAKKYFGHNFAPLLSGISWQEAPIKYCHMAG